jgi:hypothetical protein
MGNAVTEEKTMTKELRKIVALNNMLNEVCAATPDRVYGLYCGLIHEALAPKVKAYSDQLKAAKSEEMKRYETAYAEWARAHNGQKETPEMRAEVAALQLEYGVIEEIVALDALGQKLGDELIEVVIPQMPVHVIPANTQAGVIINFMDCGCISVEAAQEYLDKLVAKEAKQDDARKGPGKPKKAK